MKIRVYKSFEEQAAEEANEASRQPPLERLKETVELILHVYGVTRQQLMVREKSKRINIMKYK